MALIFLAWEKLWTSLRWWCYGKKCLPIVAEDCTSLRLLLLHSSIPRQRGLHWAGLRPTIHSGLGTSHTNSLDTLWSLWSTWLKEVGSSIQLCRRHNKIGTTYNWKLRSSKVVKRGFAAFGGNTEVEELSRAKGPQPAADAKAKASVFSQWLLMLSCCHEQKVANQHKVWGDVRARSWGFKSKQKKDKLTCNNVIAVVNFKTGVDLRRTSASQFDKSYLVATRQLILLFGTYTHMHTHVEE